MECYTDVIRGLQVKKRNCKSNLEEFEMYVTEDEANEGQVVLNRVHEKRINGAFRSKRRDRITRTRL